VEPYLHPYTLVMFDAYAGIWGHYYLIGLFFVFRSKISLRKVQYSYFFMISSRMIFIGPSAKWVGIVKAAGA
jgi:hypothetical protein